MNPPRYDYLQDLAAGISAGGGTGRGFQGRDRSYHWARRVLRLYGGALLVVLTLALTVGPYVGELMGSALQGRSAYVLARAGRMLGPVLSETDRVKFAVTQAVVEEKFPDVGAAQRSHIAESIYVASKRRGVDPLLALAIIQQESNYEHEAESFAGALGLMQVRPFVGKEVASDVGIAWNGRQTLLDPALNVRIGIAYLARMKDLYQDSAHALMAYNLGPYRLKGLLERGQTIPTRYSDRVLEFYRRLQRNYLTALTETPGTATSGDENRLAMASDESGGAGGI